MRSLKAKNQKVLITGSYGYLGSCLVQALKTKQIEYLTIDKMASSDPRHFCFDLKDGKQTLDCIEQFKPNCLIHCATHSALAYQHQFLDSFKEDSLVLFNLLEALKKTSDCCLIYFSSSYVYSGLSPESSVHENSLLRPTHHFGIAKSFFEQLLMKTHANSVIFRLFSVFGPGNYLFPNSVHNMVQECQEMGRITVWGEGKRKMQYIFIKDVIRCLERDLSPGIYNVGGDEYLSTLETAKIIAEIFGGDLVFRKDKREGETLPFGDNSKIKGACGQNFFTPFATAIREYRL